MLECAGRGERGEGIHKCVSPLAQWFPPLTQPHNGLLSSSINTCLHTNWHFSLFLPCLFPASQPGANMGVRERWLQKLALSRTRCRYSSCIVLVQRRDEKKNLLVEVGQLAWCLMSLLHHAADLHQHRVATCALPLSEHTKQRQITTLTVSMTEVSLEGSRQIGRNWVGRAENCKANISQFTVLVHFCMTICFAMHCWKEKKEGRVVGHVELNVAMNNKQLKHNSTLKFPTPQAQCHCSILIMNM